jgi:methylated-DNA-protein-cysteine methyltransferase related protein
MTETTARIVAVLKALPRGTVTSYGEVASAAGIPNGARAVVRVLHSMSRKEGLPWHRVIRSDGRIALPHGEGFELQKALLEEEGVSVSEDGRVTKPPKRP